MSNERIVYTNADGSVAVEIPSPQYLASGGSMEALQARVTNRVGASNVRRITTAELPANRLYRNAWDDSNPEVFVGVSMTKAKEIAHGRRRAKRDEVFAPDLAITSKAAQGIPLKAGENAAEASQRMTDYKANVDDVAQAAIDAAADATELEAVETANGFI